MSEISDTKHINAVDLTVATAAIDMGKKITSGEIEAADQNQQQKIIEQIARLEPRPIDYTEGYELMRLIAGDHDMIIRFVEDGSGQFTVSSGSLLSESTTNNEGSSLDLEDAWENSDG